MHRGGAMMSRMPDTDRNTGRRRGLDGSGGPGVPRPRMTPWILIAVVVVALIVLNGVFSSASRDQIDLSKFKSLVANSKITGTVSISSSDVSGTYTGDDGNEHQFVATLPPGYDTSTLTDYLDDPAHSVPYKGVQPSPWLSLLASVLPLVLLMGLVYWFLFRRMGAGGAGNPLTMAKNKVKRYDRKALKT